MPLTKTLFSRSALSSSFIDKAGSSVSSSFHTRGASALSSSFIGKTGTAVSASFMAKDGAAVSASFMAKDGAAVSGTFATRASVSSSLTQGNESVQFDQVTGSTALFTGRMTVGEVFTQYVSSSVLIESSGSTKLGNESTDLHQVTGSMSILSGSLTLTGNVSGSSTSTVSFGALTVAGKVTTHLLPTTDDTYDLGSANYRWANIYTTDLQLANVGTDGNEIDGTTGNWTIQEGEEDLYLLNRKNGKKYKFNLTELG